jgi:hypothetical protein
MHCLSGHNYAPPYYSILGWLIAAMILAMAASALLRLRPARRSK